MSSAIAAATSPESVPRAELTAADWDRFRRTALFAAGGGLAAFVVLGLLLWLPAHRSPPAVLPVVPGGVQLLAGQRALGCLVFLMLQYVTGGAWGLLLRRILEAAAGTLPLLAVLFLPVLVGLPFASKYTQWTRCRPARNRTSRPLWLSAPFVLVRAVIYFACWIGMA